MGDQLLQFATETAGYRDAPFELGTTAHRPHVGDDGRPSTGWHAQFGDVDNDGLADLFIAKGNVDQMPGMAMRIRTTCCGRTRTAASPRFRSRPVWPRRNARAARR